MLDKVRQLPLFSAFTEYQIQCYLRDAQEVALAEGQVLFKEGDAPSGLYVLLEGAMEVTKRFNGQDMLLATYSAGEFFGEISLLTGMPVTATVRATTPSRVLKYDKTLFDELLKTSPIIGIMLSKMAERLRNTEAMVQQHEKLSALGKLSAGLAHELNNPASANIRASRQLPETLTNLQALALRLTQLNLTPDQLDYLNALQNTLMEHAARPQPTLDPLTQSDLEEALTVWIEAQGVPDGWRLAPVLVSARLDVPQLAALHTKVGPGAFGSALAWIEGMLTVLTVLRTIEHSSKRIFDLIKAIKAYSYMDQTPVQDVDIHEGLENTLIILGHKLKDMTIIREYDRSLPRVTVYGSELNQVWTNIIDNAIDAMHGRGKLWLRTRRELDRVIVEIADNGPGIPPEIQSRIFEPFFTTKGVGEGSGMGLDIAYRIVVDRHHGNLSVTSQPGDTCFEVCLPIHQTLSG
ncbi:MAG: cyclic nucleotide-binding domain-containing protein [Anaerolineae bacterium]|nr:cyclic nucleotide-binding domain-containing protein [Anaerolineae bacterium]